MQQPAGHPEDASGSGDGLGGIGCVLLVLFLIFSVVRLGGQHTYDNAKAHAKEAWQWWDRPSATSEGQNGTQDEPSRNPAAPERESSIQYDQLRGLTSLQQDPYVGCVVTWWGRVIDISSREQQETPYSGLLVCGSTADLSPPQLPNVSARFAADHAEMLRGLSEGQWIQVRGVLNRDELGLTSWSLEPARIVQVYTGR